jgi:HlyD family secretion protein
LWLLLAGLFLAGGVYALLPQPIVIEAAIARREPLEVTINQTGITRVRDRYQVSSPVAGQLIRIELRSGDPIKANETLLATIRPSDPSMLDARQVAETEARASAAKLAVDRADARKDQALAALEAANSHFKRVRNLHQNKFSSPEEYESAQVALRTREDELKVCAFEREIAQFEHEQALAALLTVKPTDENKVRQFEIFSPIDGTVLRVFQESATVVSPGTALLEVGNPRDLEISVDVLSNDAVKISPGNEMRLLHWGGESKLSAQVRVIEPAAFTKISALGVEEQRVNVIGDFRETDEGAMRLGDGYRVEAEIVVWRGEQVLQVPTSALFRVEGNWCVFVVQQNQARSRIVQIGKRNALFAEVLDGLQEGDIVINYPSDLIHDGVTVSIKKD